MKHLMHVLQVGQINRKLGVSLPVLMFGFIKKSTHVFKVFKSVEPPLWTAQ